MVTMTMMMMVMTMSARSPSCQGTCEQDVWIITHALWVEKIDVHNLDVGIVGIVSGGTGREAASGKKETGKKDILFVLVTTHMTIGEGASVIICLVDEFCEIAIDESIVRIWNCLEEFGGGDQIVYGHVYRGEAGDEGRLEDGAGN